MPRRNKSVKEFVAEDECFVCKDGGHLRICDSKDCLKVYHPHCVREDDSLLTSETRWICGWHSCFSCLKTSKFHCFTCSFAVCGRCFCDAEFAIVKGRYGFCDHCLMLVRLIEDPTDVDSNGSIINFNDSGTYEFLFKKYWEMMKEKQSLTAKDVQSAINFLKSGKVMESSLNAYESLEGEAASEFGDASDYDGLSSDIETNRVCKRKRNEVKLTTTKQGAKSAAKEIIGWASKPLFEFLKSTGKDVTHELSQHEVTALIIQYCNEHKLFHPEKKHKVICDPLLHSLLKRKSVTKKGIYRLLTSHFAENMEDEYHLAEYISKEDEKDSLVPFKRELKLSLDEKTAIGNEVSMDMGQDLVVLIAAENIKLVYLKRSLVEELAKWLDTFDSKLIGSFVRVKSDPYDYRQRNSHQLVQVIGIEKTSLKDEASSAILLKVSNMRNDIPLCKLSDDDFTEEEIKDLHERVKIGMLKRPTVMEFEEKARTLHEDIIKHWIPRRLASLQNFIKRANEKGWRRELEKYIDERELLQTPQEQLRLLHDISKVKTEVAEIEPTSKNSPRKMDNESSVPSEPTLTDTTKRNGISCFSTHGTDSAGLQQQSGAWVSGDLPIDSQDLDSIWYCITPSGYKKGPYSMTVIKEWIRSCPNSLKYRIFKSDQNSEEAILLSDFIQHV